MTLRLLNFESNPFWYFIVISNYFLIMVFNRKFDITFDLNNGAKEEIIQVKLNITIPLM